MSGIAATTTGYVRDPFGTCAPSTTTFSLAACNLNHIPAGRLDPNAIKLLNLYPAPTNWIVLHNFASAPTATSTATPSTSVPTTIPLRKNRYSSASAMWTTRNISRASLAASRTAAASSRVSRLRNPTRQSSAYTHVFTPTTINVARVGCNHLHTTRFGPEGNTLGIPAQYGIPGIPQVPENGGLPGFAFGGLSTLGGNNFLPSDEVSQTLQITDDFTKIYGKHSFKMGIEYQHVKFSTLQPAWSRGQFDYNGTLHRYSESNSSSTGIAQFLLHPKVATVPDGVDYSGGSDQVRASNINKTYDDEKLFRGLLPGRLEGHSQVDSQSRPALGLLWTDQRDQWRPGQLRPERSTRTACRPTLSRPPARTTGPCLPSFIDSAGKGWNRARQTDKYGKGLLQTQKNQFCSARRLRLSSDSEVRGTRRLRSLLQLV